MRAAPASREWASSSRGREEQQPATLPQEAAGGKFFLTSAQPRQARSQPTRNSRRFSPTLPATREVHEPTSAAGSRAAIATAPAGSTLTIEGAAHEAYDATFFSYAEGEGARDRGGQEATRVPPCSNGDSSAACARARQSAGSNADAPSCAGQERHCKQLQGASKPKFFFNISTVLSGSTATTGAAEGAAPH